MRINNALRYRGKSVVEWEHLIEARAIKLVRLIQKGRELPRVAARDGWQDSSRLRAEQDRATDLLIAAVECRDRCAAKVAKVVRRG